jgi:cell division protein FtsZ
MLEEDEQTGLKFVVAGAGGAGCNSIDRLAKSGFTQASLVSFNTDKKQLDLMSENAENILIGSSVTKGLGAGGDPLVAEKAALSSKKQIEEAVHDADLVFLLAGMGGGTGTGSAPVIAKIAKDHGAMVIGFVTFPFSLERSRIKTAQAGIANLTDICDTLVVIENDKLVRVAENMKIEDAFRMADDVAAKAVSSISEVVLKPSLMNLDFADLGHVMRDGGLAMMSHGEASGIGMVEDIADNVLNNPLLSGDQSAASGALVHFIGGPDMTLGSVTDASELMLLKLPSNCNVVWGARTDEEYRRRMEAFAIFTGIPSPLLLNPDIVD